MPDEKPICVRCRGSGVLPIEGDDTTVQQCICSYSRALKAHLGAEIATAPLIDRSPLFVPGPPGEPPKIDRTRDNLFLKGYWRDLLSHLKWALGCKGPMFRYRLVTDEKLRNVYLGKEAYATQAKARRDEMVTFNALPDLVGPEIDLVIIRLGFLGYKNIAMPGILKEALMIREFACKPTWIVEVPTSIFGPGHFSFSEEVFEYITDHFETLNLVRKESARSDDTPHGFSGAPLPDEDSVGLGSDAPVPVVPVVPSKIAMPEERFTSPPVQDTDLPGEGRNARRPTKGKKKSSGEPV